MGKMLTQNRHDVLAPPDLLHHRLITLLQCLQLLVIHLLARLADRGREAAKILHAFTWHVGENALEQSQGEQPREDRDDGSEHCNTVNSRANARNGASVIQCGAFLLDCLHYSLQGLREGVVRIVVQ